MDWNRYYIACENEIGRREKLSYGQLVAKYPEVERRPERFLDEQTKKKLLLMQGRR